MTGHIFIYNYIGSAPGEISVKNIQAQLDSKATEYIMHIVSGGGDVFEGFGIYNLLKNTGKPITAHIEGDCASIATLIAFAADKIVMNKASRFMIHNPHISDLKGDARVLRNVANQLEKIKNVLLDVSATRAARNGNPIDRQELSKLYDEETYLTAEETQHIGFADEVKDAIKAVAKINIEMEKTNHLQRVINWLKIKFKNQVMDTLEDGRSVAILAEGEDWTGAQILLETGEALPAGEYKLKSGVIVTVDESSTIQTKQAAELPAEPSQEPTEDMENKKIQELEAKVAQLEEEKRVANEASAAAAAEATQAKNVSLQFENKILTLSKEFETFKAQAAKTVGDTTPLPKGPVNKSPNDQMSDPMGEDALKYFKTRNLA